MPGNGKVRTVLIVDDEERLRRALERSLRQESCRTRSAASGEEALALLKKTRIDLVITDLVMPGMDGMALIRSIRNTTADLKIIIITAYGSAESMREAEDLGVACYMAKPFDLSDLKSKVKELLWGAEDAASVGAEPGSAGAPGTLQVVCSGTGRTMGAVAGLLRKALQCIKLRNIMLAAGRVTGVVTGVRLSIHEFGSALKKRS